MSAWKSLLPPQEALATLARIAPGEFFVDPQNDPVWGAVYARDQDGQWLSLSWDYVDVEFKFEIYCLAIEEPKQLPHHKLVSAGVIPAFASLKFLTRSEWVRPTVAGEVPAHFEQVIEESGCIASVPASALAVGTALFGVVLLDPDGNPLFAIAIDERESYSVRRVTALAELQALVDSTDAFTLAELITWNAPAIRGEDPV